MTRLVVEAPLPRHPISSVAQLDHPREIKSLPPRGGLGSRSVRGVVIPHTASVKKFGCECMRGHLHGSHRVLSLSLLAFQHFSHMPRRRESGCHSPAPQMLQ
jgi:hypothetical protein